MLSLVTFSIETLPNLEESTKRVLWHAEAVMAACFSIEYVVRLCVADHKLAFTFSFFGLVDIAAILPFYLSLGIDLRFLRAFRLMRLFRVFKLARYSNAANQAATVWRMPRLEGASA